MYAINHATGCASNASRGRGGAGSRAASGNEKPSAAKASPTKAKAAGNSNSVLPARKKGSPQKVRTNICIEHRMIPQYVINTLLA